MLQYDRSLQVRGQFRLSGRPGQVDAESVGDAFAIGRVGLQAIGDMPLTSSGASPCCRSGWRQLGDEPYKRGLNTKIHLAVDAHGMPLRVVVTEGTRADCKEACALIDGLSAEMLLADRGYDSNELIDKAVESGCQPVIPPRKDRREQRDYDKALYRVRHLERWRGIATRYAKRSLSFLAAVQIRCISLWAEII